MQNTFVINKFVTWSNVYGSLNIENIAYCDIRITL
jgi:hypothetical protein